MSKNYRLNITNDVMDEEEEKSERKPSFNSFDAKNYLDVKLDKGEDSKELKIRLLPIDLETGSPFKIIHMHTIPVQKEISQSGWKSYVCLKHTKDIDHETMGSDCPFCELNKKAYDEKVKAEKDGDEVGARRWKEISLANKESEVCVVRCIERGHEEDGPKFWKFNVRSDKKDPKNLITKLWKSRKQESIDEAMDEYDGELPEDFEPENILDLYNGRDLKVTIEAVYDKDGKRTKKTSISIVDYGKNRPISKDEELAEEWINDSKKWSDVFTVKPYEYLSIILDGEVPFFDKNKNKWVTKGRARDEETKEELRKENAANEKIEKAKKKAIEADDEYDDDDYDEKPSKPKKRRDDDEYDEEEKPRKARKRYDDDDDLPY